MFIRINCLFTLKTISFLNFNGKRHYQSEFKLKTYIKIAQLFLKVADSGQAEIYLSRAAPLEKETTTTIELQTQYKLAQARVWDLKRKFIEAASKFYELSHDHTLCEFNRTQALKSSLNCTVLASAGM